LGLSIFPGKTNFYVQLKKNELVNENLKYILSQLVKNEECHWRLTTLAFT
jgi:hypothetical protein